MREYKMAEIVAYLRVSTQRQGRSGLGLEAQREIIASFARAGGHVVVLEVVEVESGKNVRRPELQRARMECRKRKAWLVVSHASRASRDMRLGAELCEMKDVVFKVATMPDADAVMLGIHFVLSAHEARQVSERTKAALAVKKAQGVKLGGWRAVKKVDGVEIARHAATATRAANDARLAAAEDAAFSAVPAILRARKAGCGTLMQIAHWLTEQGVQAPGGRGWRPATVWRVLRRVEGPAIAAA
jgi:DNA invertase Pin-like site-specific DNA recombinase